MSHAEPPAGPGAAWRARALAWCSSPIGTAVIAVGLHQIIAWGTTLYVLGVLGASIGRDMGWSRGFVYSGVTVGLIASGVVSTLIGRAIDRLGARPVMLAGTLLGALCLALMARVSGPEAYLAVWALLGVAMRMSLYDAAFAGMVQVAPSNGRRAISYLTLFGGFASTVFWPIGHVLDAEFGWRETMLIFAAINLFAGGPLVLVGLARREASDGPAGAAATGSATDEAPSPSESGRDRWIALVLFGLVMAATGAVMGVVGQQLPLILESGGLATGTAVALAALKGVAQVGGRVWEILFARHLSPLIVGRIALAMLPFAFLILILAGSTFAFALLFTLLLGASNGILTIVRGAVPLALFGAKSYGAVLGLLATPYLLFNALAPTAFALLVDRYGFATAEWALVAVSLLAFAGLEVLIRWMKAPRP
jgi:MFS family permease